MNTTSFQQEQQALESQIRQAREKIARLEGDVGTIDRELQELFDQRQRFELLTHICESLDQLETLGAGHLFWGDQSADAKAFVGRARGQAGQFLEKIAAIEQRKKVFETEIEDELFNIEDYRAEMARLEKEEERKASEFLIEREISELPYRPMAMPWDREGEDGKRFRKIIALALLITFSIGGIMEVWVLPPPEETAVVEMPDRVVQLVKREPPPPPVNLPQRQEKKEEEKVAEKKDEKPTKEQVQKARAKAQTAGVLAFKKNFSDLIDASNEPALGVNAKLGADMRKNAGSQAVGLTTQRSLVAAQAGSGSGGVAVASVSRSIGGGGGKSITGVKFARVTDAIGVDAAAEADRPLSKGPGPSRTDEEIQIVFDRYKAALYRIYNRELRNNPTLRGKMVLRITIDPSGAVSACKVESTDLASPALSAEIVEKVKKFNFGAKANVQRVTILYPIDFLPAT